MLPIEILEQRQMLSVTPLADSSEIDVRGTPGDDVIVISLAEGRPNRYVFSVNRKVHSFAYGHLATIQISARSGNDRIRIDDVNGILKCALEIDAGSGNDTIRLGNTSPTSSINGGEGDDTLIGKRPKDTLTSIEHE